MPPSDAPESQFCCAGCAYVFRIIHEQGFGDFYRIKDQTIAPADATVFEPRSFAWLAQAMGEAEARTGGKPASLTVDVQGVSCAACVWLIEHVFQKEPGGREVVANAQLGTIDFTWFPGEFDG